MPEIPDIDTLVSDRKAFDAFVYTPVREAIVELERRWKDSSIETPSFVPEVLKDGFSAIQYVSVITPNYQISRYIGVADALDLKPLIFEQTKDKFTSNNEWKRSLGQLKFFSKLDLDKSELRQTDLSTAGFDHLYLKQTII